MKSVQAPHVFSVRTCLTTEARSVGCQLLRELVIVQDDIPVNVGYRHFSCRNQIEVIETYVVHLGLLVRELACTET